MDKLKENVALGLFNANAIKFGAFRLKLHDTQPDAPLSPFYIDIRIIRSFPDLLDSVADLYVKLLAPYSFDLLADVPTAATPIVAVLSSKLRIPMISPRLEAKSHGMANHIDGQYKPKQKVALVDDVITRAESKLRAIEILEQSELLVECVVVLISREQGGVEEIAKRGYTCNYAFSITDLLSYYHEVGKLDDKTHKVCIDYLHLSRTD